MTKKDKLAIYQNDDWEIKVNFDENQETFWLSQKQISQIFDIDRTVVTRHINKIFRDWELDEKSNVQKMHIPNSDKPVKFYNLDVVLAVWYKTNSKKATQFRKWATSVLKQHITQWYTINPERIQQNYDKFIKAVNDVKALVNKTDNIPTDDILDLVKTFAYTWFSLDSFDKSAFPKSWITQKKLKLQSDELYQAIEIFKKELIAKNEATEIFAQEKNKWNLEWIFAGIFQSAFGEDVYPTVEEKAANLLYFIIKNHPFNDGNKRTWAFSFIWFLQKAWFDLDKKITPNFLTTLTLLIAESSPKDKEKIIGIILLLLNQN